MKDLRTIGDVDEEWFVADCKFPKDDGYRLSGWLCCGLGFAAVSPRTKNEQ
jgi:hypothetical protein